MRLVLVLISCSKCWTTWQASRQPHCLHSIILSNRPPAICLRYTFTLHKVAQRKPVIIDESLDRLENLALLKPLGWSGLALKTCKGQTHSLLAYCWGKKHDQFMTIQDLTNPGLALSTAPTSVRSLSWPSTTLNATAASLCRRRARKNRPIIQRISKCKWAAYISAPQTIGVILTMSELDTALTGTDYLSPSRYTAFYDRYHKQHAQTVAWLQLANRQAAIIRDRERCSDLIWLANKRRVLAHYSGYAQALSTVTQIEMTPAVGGATAYQIKTASGVLYTGLLWEPTAVALRGTIILGGHETATESLVAHYRAQGLRVILPCLARCQHSFADDPARQGYYFTDDELLNLFFFVIGGSLAGMEAAELLTIMHALTQQDEPALPVALHLVGRHTLTAALAAALASGVDDSTTVNKAQPYALLVLPEEVGLLDHQAEDARANTIWNFHTHFDALTLFQMAQGTDLLFVEQALTPSACYGRALAWFKTQTEQPERHVERLVAPATPALAAAVAAQLAARAPASITASSQRATA